MLDQDKAQAAIHQIYQGLQDLSQAFDSEDVGGWLSWPPVALDMMIITNARLRAIQQIGAALDEQPLLVPEFQCGPRIYLLPSMTNQVY